MPHKRVLRPWTGVSHACGVFSARGAGFPKIANPREALVKRELAKVQK